MLRYSVMSEKSQLNALGLDLGTTNSRTPHILDYLVMHISCLFKVTLFYFNLWAVYSYIIMNVLCHLLSLNVVKLLDNLY